MRMKQPRFMSSSSQSKSRAQLPAAWPRFLKGLHRRGLRNGLRKGLGKGLRVLCCPRRPGSDTTLTYETKTHGREKNEIKCLILPLLPNIAALPDHTCDRSTLQSS